MEESNQERGQRFREQQEQQEKRARRLGHITSIGDKISPPLSIERDDGDPRVSAYSGPVTGIHKINTIIHNQKTGKLLGK